MVSPTPRELSAQLRDMEGTTLRKPETVSQTRRPLIGLLVGLVTVCVATAAWSADRTMRVRVASGLEVWAQVQPDGKSSLEFRAEGTNSWVFAGDTRPLVGKPYSVRLENRSRERIKIVVSVDGLNAFFRKPVTGRASEDVGAILESRETRVLNGWQVDEHEAQQFVFSPPEWSEGAETAAPEVGRIEIHVYQEWRRPRAGWAQREGEEQSAPASPPIGTTAGDDISSEVRRVKFIAASERPAAVAAIVYGQPVSRHRPDIEARPRDNRLGINVEAERNGLRITRVERDSIAEDAGLRVGDVITKVDSNDEPDVNDVRDLLRGKRTGDFVFIEVARRQHQVSFKIRF